MTRVNRYVIDSTPWPVYSSQGHQGSPGLIMFVFCSITVWLALCSLKFRLLFDVLGELGAACEARAVLPPCILCPCPPFPPMTGLHLRPQHALALFAPVGSPNGKWPQIPAFKFIKSPVSLTKSKHSVSH